MKSELTTGQAAKILDCSTNTVIRYGNEGLLEVLVRPSGHRRFTKESVVRLEERQRAEAQAAIDERARRAESVAS